MYSSRSEARTYTFGLPGLSIFCQIPDIAQSRFSLFVVDLLVAVSAPCLGRNNIIIIFSQRLTNKNCRLINREVLSIQLVI